MKAIRRIVVLFQKNTTYPPRNFSSANNNLFQLLEFLPFQISVENPFRQHKVFFFLSKEVILDYSEDEVSFPTPFLSLLMEVLQITQLGLLGSQVAQQLTTPLSLELLKWCKCSLGEKGRKKQEDVVRKWSAPPPKCVRPLLWWKKVFQEQPSLSKLVLKAAGQKKHPSPLLVSACVCRGGVVKLKTQCVTWFQISENTWENDRQISHSVKSYWFTAGLWDRASNCQFNAHAK